MPAFLPSHPFVVSVWRKLGSHRPTFQQYNFVDIAEAHEAMGRIANDKLVTKTTLSVVLKEVSYHNR